MRILFLVARPTQFEAPFFRFAAHDTAHELKPLFWDPQAADPVDDRELGRAVEWGFDVLAGYPHAVAPKEGGTAWIERELASGCDLLIVNGYTLGLCRKAAAIARRHGVRTALRLDSVRFSGDRPPTLARRWFVRYALGRRFDSFLGTSSLTLEYLALCGLPPDRCGLFPYAVDHEHFRNESARARAGRDEMRRRWGVPEAASVVLAVSKLHPREAPWDLIEAAPGLPSGVHIVIVGDGPERAAVEERAGAIGGGRIHFPGYVPYRSLPEVYAAADLFVHVPQEERWGVSVAEALATGLPVIAGGRVGAGVDLISPGQNGFTVVHGNVEGLTTSIERALSLPGAGVRAASAECLARWDYRASWQSLLAFAAGGTG